MLVVLSEVKFSPHCSCTSPSCVCLAVLLAGLRQSCIRGAMGFGGQRPPALPCHIILAHTIYVGRELCSAKNVQWGE